ncbi:MAG: hypothetical protein RLZZ420_2520 [Bacteroidota bacterium]|jgi:hypothetical protein
MNYSSLYCLAENGIIYFGHDLKEHFVPFSQMGFGKETGAGLLLNMQIDKMLAKRFLNINAYYHLGAVIEKYIPDEWDWEQQMYLVEETLTSEQSEKAFLKEQGMNTWPKFYDDFNSDNFDAKYENWAKSQHGFRCREQIKFELPRKVQELIYERSISDFIQLNDDQVQRLLNPELW